MACFADINVSQGSVATYARCDETFNIHLTANWPRNLPAILFKSRLGLTELRPWVRGPAFLAHPVYEKNLYSTQTQPRLTSWRRLHDRDGTGSHFVTQRPSDPGIQRPIDSVTQWPSSMSPSRLMDAGPCPPSTPSQSPVIATSMSHPFPSLLFFPHPIKLSKEVCNFPTLTCEKMSASRRDAFEGSHGALVPRISGVTMLRLVTGAHWW